MTERFTFTNEILDRAEELRKNGSRSWAIVAELLGCSEQSLLVTLTKRKNGRWIGATEKGREKKAAIEGLVKTGMRKFEVSTKLGMTYGSVDQKYKKMGLGLSERIELQQQNPEVFELLQYLERVNQRKRQKGSRFVFRERILTSVIRLRKLTEMPYAAFGKILGCNPESLRETIRKRGQELQSEDSRA